MKELIKVTTNEQGLKVASARELHEKIESKERFSKWFEKMLKFGFDINVDYTPYQMVHPSNKEAIVDYALTLDMAKELAMVSRLPKGKEVRQYFIECEKALKETAKPKTQIEALLESVQLLHAQELRLSNVENKLAQLEESRNVAIQELLIAERSTESIPEETTRTKIRRLINQYCNANNADHRSVWHVIYDRLYYRYGVSLRAVVKKKNESVLDIAERLGHLEKIFAICSNELN